MKQALEEPKARVDPAVDQRRGAANARVASEDAANKGPAAEGESRPGRRPAERKEPQGKVGGRLQAVRRHPLAAAGVAIVLIACVVGGVIWWLNARQYESTDDAFIDARTISISSQVNGAIVDLAVDDNQSVDANAVLLRIDDRDYRSAVDQAQAQIDQAVAGLGNLDAQVAAQQARNDQAQQQVTQAQAALSFSQDEDKRAQELPKRGAGTQQQAQQTASDLRQKQAAMDGAQANLIAGQKQIDVLKTQRQQTQGQLEQARATKEEADANLARTQVTAWRARCWCLRLRCGT